VGSTESSFTAAQQFAQTIFNRTQTPLTASVASAIAVPDGDPVDEAALGFGSVGIVSAFMSGYFGMIKYGSSASDSDIMATAAITFVLAALGLALAIALYLVETHLPSSCTQQNAFEFQGVIYLAFIVLIVAGLGALGTGYALWHASSSLLMGVMVGVGLAAAVAAIVAASIAWVGVYNECK
jgi:hypothetical protein